MKRVLVIDDECGVLDIVGQMVERIGFIPLVADSSMEACKIFHKENPWIIITDLRMDGEIDGIALCSRFLYLDQSVSVIAMSGHFNEYDKIYCLAAGFTDFLQKPISLEELSSALQCAFERRSRWTKLS